MKILLELSQLPSKEIVLCNGFFATLYVLCGWDYEQDLLPKN